MLSLQVTAVKASAELKDRYVFRAGESVVGVHDLKQAEEDLAALNCRFPDALLEYWSSDSFRTKWRLSNDKLAQLQGVLAEDQNTIIFLASLRQLWKLMVYVEGQGVILTPELERAALRTDGCPKVGLTSGKMRDSFARWLKVEVYLRSRYAPSGLSTAKEWREKRLQSIAQFVDSLDKQLSHEHFW